MKKTIILLLLIPTIAFAFTYKNNPQTGKPDLVTTSVSDLTDYGVGYVTSVHFNSYSTSTQTKLNNKLGVTTQAADSLKLNGQLASYYLSGTPALPNGTTATTQSQGDNSTKLSTTAYTDLAVAGSWVDYSASTTTGGFSGSLTRTKVFYRIRGKRMDVIVQLIGPATGGAPLTFTLPNTSYTAPSNFGIERFPVYIEDASAQTTPGLATMDNNTATVTVYKDWAFANFTVGTARAVQGSFTVNIN